jgi:hypothetical protein
MLALIDSLWWLDAVLCLVLGVWLGRRWERVRQEAVCAARLCPQILKTRAENASLHRVHDFMRTQLRHKDERIHALKTSNGILGKEVEKLTYQLPRPVRKMVA